jgi:hypothetical protein
VLEYLRHALDGHPFLPLGSKLGIFGDFSGWVGAEREKAFRVKAVGTV